MPLARQQKKFRRLPKALVEWLDAAKLFPSLSDALLQLARELQIPPRQLESIARHPEQPGECRTLDQLIERLYRGG
jgi:hypothetical protein